jgi:uncharacterized protein YdaU (DUF1376 family)
LNYYPFHIGDYVSATRHLSWEEDAAFRRLLDTYYTTEKPIPADMRQACRLVMAQTDSQREAVQTVLAEFFEATELGWINKRADAEIAAMKEKQQKQRDKANKRWGNAKQEGAAMPRHEELDATASKSDADAMPPTPTPTPVNNPHSPQGGGDGATAQGQVPCPYESIVSAYHDALPMLPKVRLMDDKRRTLMRKRWAWVLSSTKADGTPRATNGTEALAWFRSYFERAAGNAWLTGQAPSRGHEGWKADLEFLLRDAGLKAVIERTEAAA